MKIELKTFNDLDLTSLYHILDLRNRVFVVEQNCVYLDTDYKDLLSHHLMFTDETGQLHAYARILPPGLVYNGKSSIGRVVTSSQQRNSGLGKQLMKEAIKNCLQLFPDTAIQIEAQSYLIRFYSSFGFVVIGEDYLLDGIPHREMILEK
ncbi:MAG: GNAT family N-acetyltransferase [Saprospiraceae bacterium]|nr:GNAT family N-acetyltransferase [Saprospiraceae bacterium]